MENQDHKELPLWTKVVIYISPLLGFVCFLVMTTIYPVRLDFEKIIIIGGSLTIFVYVILFLGRFFFTPKK
jgi:uncharacterized membrane protein